MKRRDSLTSSAKGSNSDTKSRALPPSLSLLLRQYKVEQQAQRILLGRLLADSDLVFAHPSGKALDPGVVSHTFAKALRKAGRLAL